MLPAFVLVVILILVFIGLMLFAFFLGAVNSLIGLYLDESYGYFSSPLDALRLLTLVFVENLGFRQLTVIWRFRSLFMGNKPPEWGNMERVGVGKLA